MERAKKAKEDTDKLKQANEALIESVSKQRLEFETLVKVAKDVNQSEITREQALKRLNEILPDTIGKLNQQNIATEQGAAIIRDYIKAVEAKATAELLSGRIAANNVQIFDLQQKSLNDIAELNKDIERNTRLRKSLEGSGRLEQEAITQRKIGNAQKEIVNTQKETRIEIDKINKLNETLRSEYERQIPIVNTLNDKKQSGANKEKSFQEQINDLIKKYKQEIAGINWDQVNRGIDGTNKRLDTALDALKEITLKGVKPTSESFRFLTSEVEKFRSALDYKNFRENLQKINEDVKAQGAARKQLNNELKASLDNATRLISSQIKTEKALSDFRLKEFEKQIELQKQLQSTIEGGLTNAFTSVFEAIANGEDAFKALGDSVKRLALDLIRVVIQMTVVKALANALMPGLGGAGVGAAQDLLKVRGDFLVRSLSRAF